MRQVAALLAKDVRVELRTGELTMTALLFAGVLVALFLFAGFSSHEAAADAAPGLLWIATAFEVTLIVARTFERERDDRAIQGLSLIPGAIASLYVAKLLYNWVVLSLVQLVLVLLLGMVLGVDWGRGWLAVAAALGLGGLGLCALGTTLSALLATVRLREALVPILLFPLVVPLLIAGTQACVAALAGLATGSWISVIVGFDLIFLALGQWLFGVAIDEAG